MKKTIIYLILILFFVSSVSALTATINTPSSGWNNTYAITLNVTTDINSNVTFNTSVYATLTTLYLNDTNGTIVLNTTFLNEGNNTITVYAVNATDAADTDTQTVLNVAIDVSAPTWNETPSNKNSELGSAFSYNINASDTYNTVTYYVNQTSNFTISATGVITNTSSLPLNAVFYVNITANDSLNNRNSTIISITVLDTTAPSWDTALQNQSYVSGNSLNYDVDASDSSSIDTYFINDTFHFTINTTNGTIVNNGTVAVGSYYLNVSVNDTSNNVLSQVITVTVTQAAQNQNTGGGGSRGTSTVYRNVVILDAVEVVFEDESSEIGLNVNQEGNFKCNGELHTIKVSRVSDKKVTLVLHSQKTMILSLSEGESGKVDVDSNPNNLDLEITVNSISSDNIINLTMTQIDEPINPVNNPTEQKQAELSENGPTPNNIENPDMPDTPQKETGSGGSDITGAVIGEDGSSNKTPLFIIFGIIIFICLGLLVNWYFMKKG